MRRNTHEELEGITYACNHPYCIKITHYLLTKCVDDGEYPSIDYDSIIHKTFRVNGIKYNVQKLQNVFAKS